LFTNRHRATIVVDSTGLVQGIRINSIAFTSIEL